MNARTSQCHCSLEKEECMPVVMTQKEHAAKPPDKRKIFEIPPLEGGDILTREEFERRYNAMPYLKKAELIEGRVYMPAAVRRSHGKAHSEISGWLLNYCIATPGVELNDNTTVRLDESNESQPDLALRITSETLGRSRISADDYLEGPPELIVEVAGSSVSYDLHDKFRVYQRNRVQEYIVWQIYENRLDWFQLVAGKYAALTRDEDEMIRSQVFPGLWLAVDALLAGDLAEVMMVLQQGIQTEEHAVFVQKLNEQHE